MLYRYFVSTLKTFFALSLLVGAFNVYARAGEDTPPPPPAEPGSVVDEGLAAGLQHHRSGDFAAAWQLYNDACNRGLAMGCNNVGVMLAGGMAGRVDIDAAFTHWERACDRGVAMACGNWGLRLMHPLRTRAEMERGLALMARGCAMGSASACLQHAQSQLSQTGAMVGGSLPVAYESYQRSCDLNAPDACAEFAELLITGVDGRGDPDRARTIATRGCVELHSAASCVLLATRIPGVESTYWEASQWMVLACRYGDTQACLFGPALATRGARIRPATHEQRLARLPASCANGNGDACAHYGEHLLNGTGVPQDVPRAMAMFQQGCAANSGSACDQLGVAASNGEGLPQDYSVAARWFRRACDLESGNGCYNLAQQARFGRGMARDDALADSLTRQACNLENDRACIALASSLNRLTGPPATVDAPNAGLEVLERQCAAGGRASCREAYVQLMRVPGTPAQLEPRFALALDYQRRVCELDGGSNCAVTADPSLQTRLRELRALIARCEAEGRLDNCK